MRDKNYDTKSVIILTNLDSLIKMTDGIMTEKEKEVIMEIHSRVSDRVNDGIYGDKLKIIERDDTIDKILGEGE